MCLILRAPSRGGQLLSLLFSLLYIHIISASLFCFFFLLRLPSNYFSTTTFHEIHPTVPSFSTLPSSSLPHIPSSHNKDLAPPQQQDSGSKIQVPFSPVQKTFQCYVYLMIKISTLAADGQQPLNIEHLSIFSRFFTSLCQISNPF